MIACSYMVLFTDVIETIMLYKRKIYEVYIITKKYDVKELQDLI